MRLFADILLIINLLFSLFIEIYMMIYINKTIRKKYYDKQK